jgi:hypothetical protein
LFCAISRAKKKSNLTIGPTRPNQAWLAAGPTNLEVRGPTKRKERRKEDKGENKKGERREKGEEEVNWKLAHHTPLGQPRLDGEEREKKKESRPA